MYSLIHNRLLVNRLWLIAGLVLAFALAPAVAQKKQKDAPKPVVAPLTPAQVEEESMFTDGMRFSMADEPTRAIEQFEKLLKKYPTNVAAQFGLASSLIKVGKTTEAVAPATKAWEADKTNKYYALLLAELFVKQKRYAEAEDLYEAILKLSPDNVEYGVELAAVYLFDEKPDKALAAYDRVERETGLNEEITRQKQRIYLKQNKIEKAIAEAERLAASDPGDPDLLLEGAELLIANDRPDQAVGWIDRALALNPDQPQAHIMLADIYRRKGDLPRASQELDKVIANPNVDASMKAQILASYVGIAGNDANAQKTALKMAQDLVKTSPKDAKTQVMLADLLMQQNQKREARDAYAQAARLDGSAFEVWGALIQLDGDLNLLDSLLTDSQKALELFPTQGLFWYSNGSAHLAKKHYQEAADALEESRKLSASNAELTNFINAQLGDAYNALGNHPESDDAYTRVLKQDPRNDHVLNNYSYFLSLRKEKLPEALKMAEKLVERNPTNATFLDTYAWVLYVTKDYAKARQYLEKAIAAEAGTVSGTIIEHYGDVLFQLGERDKAIDEWKKAKAKGDASADIDKKIATGKINE
jgi:tetratricopeptide (TPR) repeat protein